MSAFPATKRAKANEPSHIPSSVIITFTGQDGVHSGSPVDVPVESSSKQLELLINSILSNAEPVPFAFYINDVEISTNLRETLVGLAASGSELSFEDTLNISYVPLSLFRVRPVTRCVETMPGHTDAVLHVSYSPDGSRLASGGGDMAVRFWDVTTSMPRNVCIGHKHHVLCTIWSPDGRLFISADRSGDIRAWDPRTCLQHGQTLNGHSKWVTGLAFEPFHSDPRCIRLASSSKDQTIRIWNLRTCLCETIISGHTDSVECVKWGGNGLLYTCSRDRTIKVWAVDGSGRSQHKLVRTLTGHAHRINSLALNCDFILRTGPYQLGGGRRKDPPAATPSSSVKGSSNKLGSASKKASRAIVNNSENPEQGVATDTDTPLAPAVVNSNTEEKEEEKEDEEGNDEVNLDEEREIALQRYNSIVGTEGERLVSCSDDFTLFMWLPQESKTPVLRMTGHQQLVNHIAFSPDGRFLASASFDKKVKLWCGRTGRFLATLNGHVGAVYQVSWSPDSNYLVSASKDSTVKLWNIKDTKKAMFTLPGHEDEVYTLDWSPMGSMVASGSKDRTIKIWHH